MHADLDLYVRRATWLHRLDPRVKLAFVIEATLLTFLLPSLWTSLALAGVSVLLIWRAQTPRAQMIRIARIMAPLLIMVFALSALFGWGSDAAWLRLGPLAVGPASLLRGAFIAARLLALALIVFVWLLTTDQAAMVRGFLALGMPYEWGLTLALALRYLPIFAGLFAQVSEAQQARGLELEQRGFWNRLQAYRPVLVAMVIGALRGGERLGWALEARAVGAAGVRRTTFRPLRLRSIDWLILAVLLLALLAAVALKVAGIVY